MNSTELVRELRLRMPSLTAVEAANALDTVFEIIRDEILEGNSVVIRGFGKFGSRAVAARDYRNPLTGQKVSKPARRLPDFDYAKILQDQVAAETPLN
jgi:nucleoid DNA-binding protein